MSSRVLKRGEIIPLEKRSTISLRYRSVTKAINKEFYNSQSETANSRYVGSYGRGTAIDTSDIDILVELPQQEYERFDNARGNGQSRLLQAVKEAISVTYPRSDIRADGQVVKIAFSDGIRFEILPAFKNYDFWGNWDGTYIYPDTNMGGNWCSTNPIAEQNAMKEKNDSSNGLLYDTCKHLRFVRDQKYKSYHLSGIVIDSFIYQAIGNWSWALEGNSGSAAPGTFERSLLEYFERFKSISYLTAPGSGQVVDVESNIICLEKVLKHIAE